MRKALGDNHILGVRIPGSELIEDGLDTREMQEVARRLEATGLIDYLNVSVGTNMDRLWRAEHWPPTPAPHGLYVHLAAGIKEVVDLPVFAVGRVVNPDHAEAIIKAGEADMVAMTRAHIADPQLVTKIRENRPEEIRPCVGANVCIRNGLEGRTVSCIHNPETSREALWKTDEQAKVPRRVLVVGGGPAGLEAARVCAKRGHQVTLFEQRPVLGGQLRAWCAVPSMQELEGVVSWRERELEKHQVRVHLSRRFELEDAAALSPEVVVLAAGSRTALPMINGVQTSAMMVAGAMEIIESPPDNIARALVWDYLGGGVGVGVAEFLSARGCSVQLVTPNIAIGDDLNITARVPLYKRLMQVNVDLIANTNVVRIEDNNVVLENVYTNIESRTEVDLLVPSHGNLANDELHAGLKAAGYEVHVIGDALAPREMDLAIAEAAIVARTI